MWRHLRFLPGILLIPLLFGQYDQDFTGTWRFDPARSQVRDLAVPPARMLNVEQSKTALTVVSSLEPGAQPVTIICPLDGTSKKSPVNDTTWNIAAKWEGSALLMSILVNGPGNYSLFERWTRSRDGSRLTIARTVTRSSGETESVLVYANSALPASPEPLTSRAITPPPATGSTSSARPGPPRLRRLPSDSSDDEPASEGPRFDPPRQADPALSDYIVTAGTHILMRLTNAIDTQHSAPGDQVYLETTIPIFIKGRLVIPIGTYVTGEVTESQRGGRMKGRSALNLRFVALTLPNGVSRDFHGRSSSVGALGSLDRAEGRIQGDGKSGTSKRVAQTTAAGAGIGAVGGLAGVAVGSAAGAAAGLATVFGGRNADVILRPGTTIELVLDRDLTFAEAELER